MSTTNRTDQREAAQREAIDAVLRALEFPARSLVPERGLRTQVIMATGSGKTRVAVRSAQELHAAVCWSSCPRSTSRADRDRVARGGRRGR
ncbi:DEAD/DEAH box helicase family protein [Streptomyces agglomeratus]|uniref:DEAD/DEAH box helicase family protein n=1 Tax=Streptomyces agglomeratus TaxID=285458 RepID=UPI000D19C0F9|nr:DEAD/DEAH box helicase family protein [Streptomyces agglomeratus]